MSWLSEAMGMDAAKKARRSQERMYAEQAAQGERALAQARQQAADALAESRRQTGEIISQAERTRQDALAAAARAREDEVARKGRIDTSTKSVSDVFGGFDDTFFNKARDDFSKYYLPQVEDQYKDAYEKLVYSLSRGPGLASGAGAKKLSELEKARLGARTTVGQKAEGFTGNIRKNVEQNRSDLLSQVLAAAGDMTPQTATSLATARADNLRSPETYLSDMYNAPEYSALSDVFSSVVGNVSNAAAAEQMGGTGMGGNASKWLYGDNYPSRASSSSYRLVK
jgi:hypothetical protein